MRRDFDRLRGEVFDVLVVGGGIYGAWAAYDATLRGLRVAWIEKGDWASGTSSASSKLIHGGLRYLQYGRLGLVRKSLAERRRLLWIGPHRVHPLRFVAPVYRRGPVGRWKLKTGLWMYDRLAGRRDPIERHGFLSRKQLDRSHGYLNPTDLRCAYTYGDCQTDDARLVVELVSGAAEAGAVAVNHARASELLLQKGEVRGARITDRVGGAEIEVRARVTLYCAGPWTEQLLPDGSRNRYARIRHSKGVHLSLPPLPVHDAVLLPASEAGRVIFLLPWYGRTLLGTTDTEFDGDPDRVEVDPSDVRYLLDEANRALSTEWTEADVSASWAGLRTLAASSDPSTASASREFGCSEPARRLFVPIGGKYSSARADAEVLVNRAVRRLGKNDARGRTGREPMPWAPTVRYRRWVRETMGRGLSLGLDETMVQTCQQRHGVHVGRIYDLIEVNPGLERRVVPGLPFCYAEIVQAARSEMVVTLDDVLTRRVPLNLLTTLDAATRRLCAQLVGRQLGWSRERVEREITNNTSPAPGVPAAHETA